MRDDVLYIAFANIVPDPKDQHWSQEGFVESFNARDLSQRLAVFQSTPTGRKGGIWHGGRGIASDGAGNIYVATAGGRYDGVTNFGSSVLKFAPRSLKLIDWFTPKNHEYLFLQNIDLSAGGVTLIPNSQLMFAGGKEGVIFLLNRETMGKLEGESAGPLQRFRATNGCGQKDCAQTLGTAFWARKNDGVLYVWDRNDVMNAYDFVNERFVTTPSAVSKEKPGMNGGPTVSANGSDAGTGIVWAVTTKSTKSGGLVPGTLRAFLASNIGQELYNSDVNAARDALGDFTKFAPPVVANGKVYVPTQSKAVVVYGLLCGKDVSRLVQVQTERRRASENEIQVQPITEEKSRKVDLQEGGSFGFLGFEFRRIRSRRGRWMPLHTPKGKKRTALLRKLKTIFRSFRSRPVSQLIEQINPILRGWVHYFSIGHSSRCFGYIRDWVEKKIRRHLARAAQRPGFGWKRWSREWLYGTLGLFYGYRVSHPQSSSAAAPS